MLEAVQAIRPNSRPLVFGGVVSRTKFYRAFRKLVNAAGISAGALKKIRKGGASEVERATGQGHLYLGHRGRAIAERHYFDARIVARDQPQPPPLA